MARLFLVGFLSLLSQVALLRELDVVFYEVELIYPLAISVWLLWTAAGAAWTRRLLPPSPSRFSGLLLVAAVLLPLDVAFLRGSRVLLGGMPGAYLPLLDQTAILAASLFPPGFAFGLLFQWAARLAIAGGRTLALAYSVESAGSVAGGLASTSLLAAGLGNLTTLLASSLCAALVAAALGRGRAIRILSAPIALGLLAALLAAEALGYRMDSWNHPHLVAGRDTPYGRVTVTSLEGQVSVFENDALAFETQGTAAEEFAHLAALGHERPRRVLVLGGGISGLLREVLKHGPERIDTVELNPALVHTVLPHLPRDIRESLEAPAVRSVFTDPRRFLRGAGSYDLILVGMPDPASGQTNRFYTREFFDLAGSRLEPGGLLAFRLSSAENFLTPPMARRLASICRAARSALGEVLVLPGATNIVLASDRPLPRDPDLLAGRLRERGIAARLIGEPYLEYLYTNDRLGALEEILRGEDAPANADASPICYQYTVMIWLSKFLPGAALVDIAGAVRDSRALPLGLLLGLAALFLLSRFAPGLRRALLAGAAGFIGMTLETVWILHYQVKEGVLFQDIGLLLMTFMAGLSAGSLILDRLARRPGRGPGSRRAALVLLAGLAALGALTGLAIRSGSLAGLPEAGLGLALAGFLAAGVFAHSSLHGIEDQGSVVSGLYAADLLGGALSAAAVTLLAIPALGLAPSAWAAAILAGLAVLLL